MEIAITLVIVSRFPRYQQQQRVHPVLVPCLRQLPEAVCRPVGPEIVAVDAEENIFLDQRFCLDQSAAGLEQLLPFVGHPDFNRIGQSGEMRFHHVGEIVNIDHSLAYSRLDQLLETMVNHRLASHFNQRLRTAFGKRAHALAQSGGHDHRGVDLRHLFASAIGIGLLRTSAGIFRSNHFFMGSSAG